MKQINEFTYQIYLTQLENIKYKKKPVQDFIKKLYEEGNNLYFNEERLEDLIYRFMLITRAIKYDKSIKLIKYEIRNKIANLANILITYTNTSKDIKQIYEFYLEYLSLSPNNLDELLIIDSNIEKLENSFYLSTYAIKEFRPFSYANNLIKLFLLQNSSNTKLVKSITSDSQKESYSIKEMENIINKYQSIIKEYNEHNNSNNATDK